MLSTVVVVIVLVSLWPACLCRTWHRTFTLVVEAGADDCYFLPNVNASQTVALSFQVGGLESQLLN